MRSPALKSLPKGLEPDELLKVVCEFKLGRFHNKDKFILAYTRLAISIAYRMSTYHDREDKISEAFLALSNVPYEVKDRMYDYNIVPYLITRIKTRCTEYRRHDHVFYTPKDDKRLKGPQHLHFERRFHELDEIIKEDANVECLQSMLQKCVETEFDRLLILYKSQGYSDNDVSRILGCSTSKVNRAREVIEQRFNILDYNSRKGNLDILTKLEQLNLKLINATTDYDRDDIIDEIKDELESKLKLDLPNYWDIDQAGKVYKKYNISHTNGQPIDERALYFVLRLDKYGKDLAMVKASRSALSTFIISFKPVDIYQERFVADLRSWLNKIIALQPVD